VLLNMPEREYRTNHPTGLRLPVALTIGGRDLPLGHLQVDLPVTEGRIAAALAELLRAAAATLVGGRDGWPRQCWQVGDVVPLLGSAAQGTVAQVDVVGRRYLVDVGSATPVWIRWADVDLLQSAVAISADQVRIVFDEIGRGGRRVTR
jgi:hypothetical protein